MFRLFKKKSAEEKLEPVDVKAVSPLLLPPEPPEEEKLAYHPENTILTEDIAMNRSIASGAGTSGGFGAYQPFLTEKEIEDREYPEAWQHDNPPNTDAPQRDFVIDQTENQKTRKAS
jgi:hypothetical protein